MTNEPIDIVYLWCDLADEKFRKKLIDTRQRHGLVVNEAENGKCRYASNDELRYSLRSIERHLPWIRHVHLLIDDDISLPPWMNDKNKKLKIHRWGSIMPSSKLPCFNANTFEFFLQDIPGLSERFLFSNDDTLVCKSVKPSFFFGRDGWPIMRYSKSKVPTDGREIEDYYIHIIAKSFLFAKEKIGICNGYKKAFGYLNHHNIDGYVKSDLIDFKKRFSEIWKHQTSHPFRSRSQIHREIFAAFAFSLGHAHFRSIKRPWYETLLGMPHRDSWHCSAARTDIVKAFARIKPALLCVNDSPIVTDEDHARVDAFLHSLFPERSSFEKDD